MTNNKIDCIDKEILKTREKISEYQNKLRALEAQKAEAENLQIVQLVRAMHLTPAELSALLAGGGIFYYFKVLKPKQKSKQPQGAELSELEYDEYDEDEEYTEALEEIADEMSNDDSEADA